MRIRLFHLAAAVLAGTILAAAGPAAAQGSSARILGVVKDGKGNPVEGVKVTITTTSNTRFKTEITTDKDGRWATILGNAVPKYIYKFEKPGFVPFQQEKKIGIGSVETFDVVLYTAEQAVAAGKAEVKKDPYIEAYNGAVEKFQQKDIPGALALAEEAVKLGPDKSSSWTLAAKLAFAMKEWNKTITYGEKALSLDPEATELYGALFEAYRGTGNKDKAAEYEKKFAAANPENPDIVYNQAVDLYNKSNFKGAEPLLRKVLELKPDHAKAHFLLGMTCVNLNKIPDMKTHLTEYLKLEPKGPEAATAKEMLDAFK